MAQNDTDLIEVGHIIAAHGVRGQVKVFSNTSPRKNIVSYSPWVIKHHGLSKVVEISGKSQGKNVIASLHDVNDRNQAEELSGAKIFIDKSQLPKLSAGDFYWSQLTGLQVTTVTGVELGIIDYLLETGANDVLVVKGDRERLIPYVMDEVIKQVDLQNNQMIVDWDADF